MRNAEVWHISGVMAAQHAEHHLTFFIASLLFAFIPASRVLFFWTGCDRVAVAFMIIANCVVQ